jgi:hypothetical protein
MERIEWSENPRRRRSRRRRSRGRRRNPSYASSRGVVRHLTSGFSVHEFKKALPLAGGALLNYYASNKVSAMLPMVASGLPSYAAGIALAGLSSLVPKVGPQLFLGGMTYQALRVINQYVMPGALRIGEYLESSHMGNYDGLVTPGQLQAQLGEYMEDNTPVGVAGEGGEIMDGSGMTGAGF